MGFNGVVGVALAWCVPRGIVGAAQRLIGAAGLVVTKVVVVVVVSAPPRHRRTPALVLGREHLLANLAHGGCTPRTHGASGQHIPYHHTTTATHEKRTPWCLISLCTRSVGIRTSLIDTSAHNIAADTSIYPTLISSAVGAHHLNPLVAHHGNSTEHVYHSTSLNETDFEG